MKVWPNSFTGAKNRRRKSCCVTAARKGPYNGSSSGRTGRTKIFVPSRSSVRRSPRAGKNVRDCVAHRALAGEIEPHAADLGFGHNIRREDFHHHARSLPQERPRRAGGGFVGVGGERGGGDGNGGGGRGLRDLEGTNPRAPPAPRGLPPAGGGGAARFKILPQAGGRPHQPPQRPPIAHEMHEATD